MSDSEFDDYEEEPVHPLFEAISRGKAHRQRLVAMFVRTRCFQPVPDDIVPLIVDYGFHLGFY